MFYKKKKKKLATLKDGHADYKYPLSRPILFPKEKQKRERMSAMSRGADSSSRAADRTADGACHT